MLSDTFPRPAVRCGPGNDWTRRSRRKEAEAERRQRRWRVWRQHVVVHLLTSVPSLRLALAFTRSGSHQQSSLRHAALIAHGMGLHRVTTPEPMFSNISGLTRTHLIKLSQRFGVFPWVVFWTMNVKNPHENPASLHCSLWKCFL